MPVEVGVAELVLDVVETESVDESDVVSDVPEEVEMLDEVDELAEDVEDEMVSCFWYTFRRDPAPQYSVLLSPHVIEQSVMAVGTEPAVNWFSHQHSPPYSRPTYL
jgi:hypothetical protein